MKIEQYRQRLSNLIKGLRSIKTLPVSGARSTKLIDLQWGIRELLDEANHELDVSDRDSDITEEEIVGLKAMIARAKSEGVLVGNN